MYLLERHGVLELFISQHVYEGFIKGILREERLMFFIELS